MAGQSTVPASMVRLAAFIAEALYASRALRDCVTRELNELLEEAAAVARGLAWADDPRDALSYWWVRVLAEKMRGSLERVRRSVDGCREKNVVEAVVLERLVSDLEEAVRLLDELVLHAEKVGDNP